MALVALFGNANAQDYADRYKDLPTTVAQPEVPTFPDLKVSIESYGAVPDGVTLCTEAFDKAIKDVSKKGGGHVIVPAGVWLTGPIQLRDNVDLHLETNALIVMSPEHSLYKNDNSSRCYPGIYAKKRTNIAVTGNGVVDGNGKYWRPVKRSKVSDTEWKEFKKLGGTEAEDGKLWFAYSLKNVSNITDSPKEEESIRADLFRFQDCKKVLVQGVTFQNSPRFHVHPLESEDIVIDGVTVRCPWNAQNGDGIDLSNCKRVLIVNCRVDVGDDGLCMKSGIGERGVEEGPTADVLIEDCVVNHAHGGFVIGSDCAGGMERIVVRNCTFSGTDEGLRFKSAPGRGGKHSDIYISNIFMNDIKGSAVTFSCSYEDRKYSVTESEKKEVEAAPYSPEFTDIHISNVVCRESAVGVSAAGIPGIKAVHGIEIKDCTFFYLEKDKNIDSNSDLTLTNVKFATY